VTSSVEGGLCRVTIIAPDGRVDVALPVGVPLADLLPTLLRHAGENLPDRGIVHGGWSLQRLGETPLDAAKSPTALSIRDGELLYLRPRQAQLPELAFDDVVDAIATASKDRSSRWLDSTTRRFSLAAALVALGLAAAVVARSGPPWLVPSMVSGALAAGLVLAGSVLARAFGDARAGVLLGYAALAYAALAGATALGAGQPPSRFGAAALLGGSAAVLVTALLAAFAISESVPALVGVATAALVAMLAALLDLTTGLTAAGTAAITVSFVLAVTPLLPMLAARMAELPLPVIPLTADELRRDSSVVSGPTVLHRTLVADQFVGGLTGATAALVAGCELLLAREPSGSAPWLLAVIAAAVALRARPFFGRLQRVWLLLAAVLGVALLSVTVAEQHGQAVRLAAVALPLLIAAAVLVVVGLRPPGSRVSPFWGRTTDIVEALVVVAIVPLALAVLGLYGYVRGLAG
jgi:type VII secretion integral membrane protein EccD